MEHPVDLEFCYPPLDSLLGDRLEDLPAPGDSSLLGQSSDSWQLQLEAAPVKAPVRTPASERAVSRVAAGGQP